MNIMIKIIKNNWKETKFFFKKNYNYRRGQSSYTKNY